MPAWPYVYELRREGTILATGQFTSERELAAGDLVPLAGGVGRVVDVVTGLLGAPRLILELQGADARDAR